MGTRYPKAYDVEPVLMVKDASQCVATGILKQPLGPGLHLCSQMLFQNQNFVGNLEEWGEQLNIPNGGQTEIQVEKLTLMTAGDTQGLSPFQLHRARQANEYELQLQRSKALAVPRCTTGTQKPQSDLNINPHGKCQSLTERYCLMVGRGRTKSEQGTSTLFDKLQNALSHTGVTLVSCSFVLSGQVTSLLWCYGAVVLWISPGEWKRGRNKKKFDLLQRIMKTL
ncbi:hypothetical protein STEG23_017307 [Scotinomys teguina]